MTRGAGAPRMDASHMEGGAMADTIWTWARLDSHGIEAVEEAERMLGADFVLAYAAGEPRTDLRGAPAGGCRLPGREPDREPARARGEARRRGGRLPAGRLTRPDPGALAILNLEGVMFGRLTRPAAVLLTVGLVRPGAGTTSAQAAGQGSSPATGTSSTSVISTPTRASPTGPAGHAGRRLRGCPPRGRGLHGHHRPPGLTDEHRVGDHARGRRCRERRLSRHVRGDARLRAWVVGIGEINVFDTPDWPSEPTGKGADKANSGHHGNRWLSLPELYDWLAEEPGAVGQWNHPTAYAGVSSEDFTGYAGWSPTRDTGMGMIEVFNDVVYESSYVAAPRRRLARDADGELRHARRRLDHRLRRPDGPARAQPHAGRSLRGDARRARVRDPRHEPRGAVPAWTGRSWAPCWPNRPATVTVRVQVDDPDASAEDAVTRIDIVTDGGVVVASQPVSGASVAWTKAIDALTARYFYARVSTASGVDGFPGPTAWTAPVWTGR